MAFWIRNLPSRKPIASLKRRTSLKPKNEEVLRPVEWKLTPTELSLPSSMEEYALIGALRLFVLKKPQWAAWYGLKPTEPAILKCGQPVDTAFTYGKCNLVSTSKIESLWSDILRKMKADNQGTSVDSSSLSGASKAEEAKSVNGDGKTGTETSPLAETEEPPELTSLFDEQQAMFDWVGIRSFTARSLAGYKERQPALAEPESPKTPPDAMPARQEQTDTETREDTLKLVDRSRRRKKRREENQSSTEGAKTTHGHARIAPFDIVEDTEAESEDDWGEITLKAPASDRQSKRQRTD